MDVVKVGYKLNKKIFEWECCECESIIKAEEDDPALIWDYESGAKNHSGQFHFTCPMCNRRAFASTGWHGFRIYRKES